MELFAGAKLYRTNYNEIVEVITIERITKTQAIAKGGLYKFRIELSSYGTASKMGNTDRWTNASYYLETPELKNKLWRQESLYTLSKADYSKLDKDSIQKILSILKTINT